MFRRSALLLILAPIPVRASILALPRTPVPSIGSGPVLAGPAAPLTPHLSPNLAAVLAPPGLAPPQAAWALPAQASLSPRFKPVRAVLPALKIPNSGSISKTPLESLKTASLGFFSSPVRGGNGVVSEGPPRKRPLVAADHDRSSVRGARGEDSEGLLGRFEAVREGRAGDLPEGADRFNYVFVPGILWDAVPDYMEPNIRRLRALGLDAEFVETDPLGSPHHNAKKIARAIEDSPKPVVLMTHSKGGVDALQALIENPSIRPMVSKLVAIQVPYYGSKVADFLLNRPWLLATGVLYARAIAAPRRFFKTIPFFRGNTFKQVSTRSRGGIAPERPPIGARTELFSVVSHVKESASIKLLLWITSGAVKRLTSRDNDGIVVPEDGILPDSVYAWFGDVGHIDPISDPDHWKRKQLGVRDEDNDFSGDFTEAILRWVFSHAPPRLHPEDGVPLD